MHTPFICKILSISIAVLASISDCVAQPSIEEKKSKPLVVLVSLDGFKPSYLSHELTPHLYKLAQEGAQATGLISAFPSLTFPNHVTLVTGQTPDQHGIVNNTMTDPSSPQRFTLGSRDAVENPFWWQEAYPIWVKLRQQGKIASTLFWPGSEVPIQGLLPNDWLRYEHNMTHEARLELLMSWLTRDVNQRPDFATLYLSDVDSAGHTFGPDSNEVKVAARKVDIAVGQLIGALKRHEMLESTTLVIVSDHGMASSPESQVIQVGELLFKFPAAKWEWLGPTAGIRLNGESAEAVMQNLSTLNHVSCWPKGEMPARFKYGTHRRIPDIVCLSDVGYSVSTDTTRKGPLGHHGYDPEHPDMHGILVVSGARIKRAELGLVNNLEVHGLLSHLLNLDQSTSTSQKILVQKIQK